MPRDERPEPNDAIPEETVVIVRYPNRRFYDRNQAKYVTLPEIADRIRAGKTVSVRDSKSNEDLTSAILMQIILEHHPERMNVLPIPILHLMIRTNDMVLAVLSDYFKQSISYLGFWQQAAKFNPMMSSMEWFKSFMPGQTGSTSHAAPTHPEASMAETLSQRLAEIERRIDALQQRPDLAKGSYDSKLGKEASDKPQPPTSNRSAKSQRRS